MTTKYICELCNKGFNQKNDYTRHKNKKMPCIPLKDIKQIINTENQINDDKNILTQFFKSCLDIMRDSEGLTGEKALRNLTYLLILKLLERLFNDKIIDIKNYEYDLSNIEEEDIEGTKNKLFKIVYFTELNKLNEDDINININYLWEYILSQHPTTNKIFIKGKTFDIQYNSTFKKLINKLYNLNLNNTNYDILGNSYEEVIKDILVGKVLGQFFTQPIIKNMMVKLIKPKLYDDGTIETCCDPTMGTGGFLNTYLKDILNQSKQKNIELNWEFIKNKGVYGKELVSETFQLAMSNMLIQTGHIFHELDRGDSIREPITEKFDNVLANPPFGIKGFDYDEFKHYLKDEYTPIKTKNAVSLFIQAIIFMLKIKGKCAMVMPDGKDLFSKTNKSLIAIREYLMKTCDLKEIIYLPSGVFTHTSIKTCVFYFVKKREGTDVLNVKISYSKTTNKETKRTYKFSSQLQTTTVKFYDFNPYEDIKNLLVEVPIDKIVSNSYSLNYAEYMKDETEEEQYEDGVVVKTLGEVCDFQNGSQLDKKNIVEGNIPVFGGGVKIVGFHNSYNRNGNETIVCGTGYPGYVNYSYGKPFWASQCFTLKSKNTNILIDKYLYYYSKIVLENEFMSKQKGTAQKFIRINQIIDVKILIPSLERQHEIVKYLDFIYEKANKTSNEKIDELEKLNKFCLDNQKIFGENVVKKLGEISIINPENMKSGQYTEINYIDITSVKGGQILELQKLTNVFPSRAKRIVKKGDILYSSVRPNLKGYVYISDDIQNGIASTGFADIRVKEPNTILSKYLYYIMISDYISDDLISKAKGAQYPAVSFNDFKTIKIPIPSLERQKEIVEYCEYNDTLIKQLEKEIENNKKQAQQFITGIVKAQVKEEVEEQTETNEVIQDTLPIEEEMIIEPKPKTKVIIKEKVKKQLVIVGDEDVVV